MSQLAKGLMQIEAELQAPGVKAQLVRFSVMEPADSILRQEDSYRLDLCLTPRLRNARACYRDRWSPHRFERIGKVFLLPPRETMRAITDGGSSQMSILCHLQANAMRNWLQDDLEWTDRSLEASLDIREANVRGLLLRLAHEAGNPGFGTATLVELIAGQLAIELGRHCLRINEIPMTGGLAPWRLKLIDERLREVREAPSLAELAELCKLSVRQLTRGFRTSRGCSIGDYIANARIDHAKRLLLTDESVKSVAYSLGFSSPSSFCYAFRRAIGVAPREFRQRTPRALQSSL